MDNPLPKLAWFPLYVTEILGSAAWLQMKDYQRGWYIQLLVFATQSDHPGHLPLDESLWRLAGARSKRFFDQESAVVLACFKRRQMDGREWIYNEQFLNKLQRQSVKIRTREEKRSGNSCRKPGFDESSPLFSSLDITVSSEELRRTVEELFEFYRELFCRDSRYTLTESRRRACELRLLECVRGHGSDLNAAREMAKTAILNLSRSDFHLCHGYFDWNDHIFKTREVFEKRLHMKSVPRSLQPGTRDGAFAAASSGEDEILPEWLSDVTKKIDTDRQTLLSQLIRERDPIKSA